MMTASNSGVMPARWPISGAGSTWQIWCIIAACVGASKGGRPATRWYSTAPSE